MTSVIQDDPGLYDRVLVLSSNRQDVRHVLEVDHYTVVIGHGATH
jgi:hypothetical protein